MAVQNLAYRRAANIELRVLRCAARCFAWRVPSMIRKNDVRRGQALDVSIFVCHEAQCLKQCHSAAPFPGAKHNLLRASG